jgi:hypothetical protein
MNNQNLILLAIGLFVSLIVAVAAVDEFLLSEHPPSEVDGLIWRVENALSRIRDLESVLEVIEEGTSNPSLRLLVRYMTGPPPAMSVRYLSPSSVKGQIFTIQNDLLSHFLPNENLVVVKRWKGIPLAAIGLVGFDLSRLKSDWASGKTDVRVLQNTAGFSDDLFPSPIVLGNSLGEQSISSPYFSLPPATASTCVGFSFCPLIREPEAPSVPGFAHVASPDASNSIQGSYILEVRDAKTEELERMIWIERDTFLIRKVVSFVEGQRATTIRVEWIILDQGFSEDDLLMPQGFDTIRG